MNRKQWKLRAIYAEHAFIWQGAEWLRDVEELTDERDEMREVAEALAEQLAGWHDESSAQRAAATLLLDLDAARSEQMKEIDARAATHALDQVRVAQAVEQRLITERNEARVVAEMASRRFDDLIDLSIKTAIKRRNEEYNFGVRG